MAAKKWLDPLDRLLEADEKSRTVKECLTSISQHSGPIAENEPNKIRQTSTSLTIEEIDVKKIIRWKYKDRPENELGDIKELAETFKSVGQQQPCILRASKEFSGKYELIVGERRWKAAELAGLKLKAVVRDFDDKEAALIQAVENERRQDLSEYAKGMSYADKIEQGLLAQKDLIEILGISKQQVSRLLSFRKIPQPLFDAIEDFRKVSARTAYELARLANKDNTHLHILIEMAEKIRDGKFGQKRIEKELNEKLLKKETPMPSNRKISGNDGRHLFTWRLDNNATPSIHFPKDIIKLFNVNAIDFDDLTQEIKKCLSKRLGNLNE